MENLGDPGNKTSREVHKVREVVKIRREAFSQNRVGGSIFLAVGFNPRNKERAKKNIVK